MISNVVTSPPASYLTTAPHLNMPAAVLPADTSSIARQRIIQNLAAVQAHGAGPRMQWADAAVQASSLLDARHTARGAGRHGVRRAPMPPSNLARGLEDIRRESTALQQLMQTARFVNTVHTGQANDADFETAMARLVSSFDRPEIVPHADPAHVLRALREVVPDVLSPLPSPRALRRTVLECASAVLRPLDPCDVAEMRRKP